MDLETFITTVYVLVDDWYKETMSNVPQRGGRPARMSDSEVLTLALVGQWRVGVPWRSERGLIRYAQVHLKGLFPTLLERSGFNYRLRQLYGVLVQLQQALAWQLQRAEDTYECVDCLDLPAYSLGQSKRERRHWFWFSAAKGWARGGWFVGHRLLMSACRSGAITGWIVGAGHINDRWLMEGFLSARQGQPQLVEPPRRTRDGKKATTHPPAGFIGGWTAAGPFSNRPYLADKGFNGQRWAQHWQNRYASRVYAVPPDNAQTERPWTRMEKKTHASHRQIIEPVFARLVMIFDIKRHQPHSMAGLYARLAAISAAYNLALLINRRLSRPEGELVSLFI